MSTSSSSSSISDPGNEAISVDDSREAVSQSSILATSPVETQNEPVETVASVSAGNIPASSVLANVRIQIAFVHVLAFVRTHDLTISFRTDAHERSDQILARVRTIVSRRLTLVQIHAMNTVRIQRITRRTNATEGSVGIETSECALVSFRLVAFVDIGASAVGAGRKSGSAIALETADDILASSVAANAGVGRALVGIDALLAGGVESVSDRTFASERSVRVDAPAASANSRIDDALVDVVHVVGRSADAFRTERREGRFRRLRTPEAVVVAILPATHADATAFRDGRVHASRVVAA